MKKCIVNVYSEGREQYERGTDRLIKSAISQNFAGDIILFSPLIPGDSIEDLPTGYKLYHYNGWGYNNKYGLCLPHKDASHQFKSFTLQFAREQGYEQVMWCDSAVVIMKNPQKYFDLAEEIGVIIFDAKGGNEAEWTADIALKLMGCNLKFAESINQCYSGVMLFDFRIDKTKEIFDDFTLYSLDKDICNGTGGSIRPNFVAHRHDQSIISYVIRKHGLFNMSFGGYIWSGFLNKWGYSNPTFLNLGI